MSSISNIFGIGLSALASYRNAIAVTGDNVANANTPGFHRRTIEFDQRRGFTDERGTFGSGVEIESVRRARDSFLEDRLLRGIQAQSGAEGSLSSLSRLEASFNDFEGQGLGEDIRALFESFSRLSTNPGGTAERTEVLEAGRRLATSFNRLAADLTGTRDSINERAVAVADEVNTIARNLYQLNEDIDRAELAGTEAADLRDRRDVLLRNLSELTSFNSFEDPDNGRLTVMIGGRTLVGPYGAGRIEVDADPDGTPQFIVPDSTGSGPDIRGLIDGGELAGLLSARDDVLPEVQTALDSLATTLAQQINAIHSAGEGLDNTSGRDFFTLPTGAPTNAAALIELNSEIDGSPSRVAAGATGAPGDNETALALADLAETTIMNGGTETASEFYRKTVARLGASIQEVDRASQFQDNLVRQVQAEIDTVSGVSLDEEAANLIRFQQSFQAASRLIAVSDELMETVIGLV